MEHQEAYTHMIGNETEHQRIYDTTLLNLGKGFCLCFVEGRGTYFGNFDKKFGYYLILEKHNNTQTLHACIPNPYYDL